MPNYRYTARDERGNPVTGTVAAPTPGALADQVRQSGCVLTGFSKQAEGPSLESILNLEAIFQRRRRVGYDHLVTFLVQLSKMMQVGIPLVTSLNTVAQQTENLRLREVVVDVTRNVEGGAGFSEALGRHPSVFPELFIGMVRAGEASGKLDQILRRLADFAKHQAELRQQLVTAMVYPAILMVVSLGVTVFLIVGIIPKFMAVFLRSEIALPLPTLFLHQVSLVLQRYWIVIAAVLALGAIGIRWYVRTPNGRRLFDTLLLRVPVIGDLARKAALSRVTKTLETLLSSGVPLLESLSIVERTCGNVVIADVLQNAQTSLNEGGTISEPLRVSGEFPPMVVQMITVGESSGSLGPMLAEISGYYDELVEHGIKRSVAFIEPVFLIVMGGIVGFIVASVILPIFNMAGIVR